MAKSNKPIFESLLTHNPSVETIDLARNNIVSIPNNFFNNTNYMKHISLSGNSISQITFNIKSMGEIEILDLSHNSITSLNQKSRDYISSNMSPNFSVLLDGNPLSCAVCEDYEFIQWLLLDSTPVHNIQNLTCRNQTLENEQITDMTLNKLKKMCDEPLERRNLIIVSIVAPVVSLTVVVIVAVTISRCVKQMNNMRKIKKAEGLLQRGTDAYEFAAFLAFCSNDEHFVYHHVKPNLEEALKSRLSTQRELVCIGDNHFNFGKAILDESVRCIRRSSLVICLLSDAFFMSDYCLTEFQQAHHMDKRIIFFVKGQIDESMLTPGMEVLYRNQARVLWSEDDNREYIMKTTWDKVSDSIVELIADTL
ncbi:hypothetical protein DPMN_174909 [Dreissena polymorpha]|uniref:TIR domain-containing protein n=2 Tax=Dreissena polymorpha TaxID=45954 RepID=A0A9D4E489_DREPO|nr:hypothetical protein DPMN_174909 [Dreissena polymorpha]